MVRCYVDDRCVLKEPCIFSCGYQWLSDQDNRWERKIKMKLESDEPKGVPESPSNYEKVDHPAHYGGKDNPYEVIKVIEAWKLGFNLGQVVKYIPRAGNKPDADQITDLRKAAWYLNREIDNLCKELEISNNQQKSA